MTPADVKALFSNGYKFNQATDMSSGSLYNWEKAGHIPMASQVKLERITEGKLVANWQHAQPFSTMGNDYEL